MPFGVVSGVGRGMVVFNGGGDRQRGRGSLGVNVGHPIVTNGDLVAWVYSIFSAMGVGDATIPKLLSDFLFKLSVKPFQYNISL